MQNDMTTLDMTQKCMTKTNTLGSARNQARNIL
jgi:hypothetical protein